MAKIEGMCWTLSRRWECVSFSALVLSLVLFQQSNMSEGKVASFALAFTLPLAVHVDLGYFYHVPDLLNKKKKKSIQDKIQTNTLALSALY